MKAPILALILLGAMLAGCTGGEQTDGPSTPEIVKPKATGEPQTDHCDGELVCHQIASGFDRPLLVFPHGGDTFVVEQEGYIYRWAASEATLWLDISDIVATCGNEMGLLGATTDDDNLYVAYIEAPCVSSTGSPLIVDRIPLNPEPQADRATELVRIVEPASNHNGGHITWGPNGKLYLGVGDGGGAGDPFVTGQDPADDLGSILSIDPQTGDKNVELYGLRNPWRFDFNDELDQLWIADVGQNCWEEINYLSWPPSEANLGWNLREGPAEYNRLGCSEPSSSPFLDPIAWYGRSAGCSVTGGLHVEADTPGLSSLAGTFLYGDFCQGTIWSTTTSGEVTKLASTKFNISSFGQTANGDYVVVDHGGAVYVLANV